MENKYIKKFKFKNTISTIILLIVVCAISVGGIVWNILNINTAVKNDMPFMWQIFVLAINVLLIAISLLFIFDVKYVVDENFVSLKIGFITKKIKILDIVKLIFVENENKLFTLLHGEKIFAIVIKPEKFNEFFSAVSKFNPAIYFETADSTDSKNQ